MTSSDISLSPARLKFDEVLAILEPNGLIANAFKGFESRLEQRQMVRNVLDAYNYNQITLIEAGTGTGKSLAYLLPALLWAAETKERTVISTNTINLQEQLLNKDIPLITKALKVNVKAVLVKGMYNYLCIRKFEELRHEYQLLSPHEADEFQKVEAWNANTADGSRSSLSFAPSHSFWDKVAAETDTCNYQECPYFKQCHFFRARQNAADAQVLIVNHHLLFADLVSRDETTDAKGNGGILPEYTRVIIDEAHNIEEIATTYFSSKVSQLSIMRLLAQVSSEKGHQAHGKLSLLKNKIVEHYRNDSSLEVSSINNRLTIDLPGMRRSLLLQLNETFGCFFDFVQQSQQGNSSNEEGLSGGDDKLRILPHHYKELRWKEKLVPSSLRLKEEIARLVQGLRSMIEDAGKLKNHAFLDQTRSLIFEIRAFAMRLEDYSMIFDDFVMKELSANTVRWIEVQALRSMVNTILVDTNLDIASLLVKFLFNKFPTVILCSATLTTDQHFRFIRGRLGLTSDHMKERIIREYMYASPFNFFEQALFVIPTDIPAPHDPSFTEAATEKIWQALQASQGNAFVLFTSYKMLKKCFDLLQSRLNELKYPALKQGDGDRQSLLNKFKSVEHSVLFGTDSFWEGVDVVGEALRCVIIVKLPFKVPSDPLIQAQSEAIVARGGNPFMEYSLPQAIVKFKQGFGRLIRNQRDRGCIVCLDNRLSTKHYGQQFLHSLPTCRQSFVEGDALKQQMTDFYRRTHFLAKSQIQ